MDNTKHASYNIHNYVIDNNANFDEVGFNNIDGLVMSQIANMPLENCEIDINTDNSKTFREIYQSIKDTKDFESMDQDSKSLLSEIAYSSRYSNMRVSNFAKNPAKNNLEGFEIVKNNDVEQFAAATITYMENGNEVNYMSFRATDNSDVGWSEDLLMIAQETTQAQQDAKDYMEIIASKLNGSLSGGGHSKGGNDFEYAFMNCNDSVCNRFISGYMYDSPGTIVNYSGSDRYKKFLEITKGNFICPQDSIIGQVLHEVNHAKFIHSVETAIFYEHDPYSWQIEGTEFQSDYQSWISIYVNGLLDSIVYNFNNDERESVYLFGKYFLENCNGEGLPNENSNLLDAMGKAFIEMDDDRIYNFSSAFGSVIVTLLIFTKGNLLDTFVEATIEKLKYYFSNVIASIYDLRVEIYENIVRIFESLYNSCANLLDGFFCWYNKDNNSGYQYATSNSYIKVNTVLLRTYAQRIDNINSRISNIDRRLDALYTRVGLQDLWNLMQADVLTGYSWRLQRCASYLYDTASDFEFAERDISTR